MQNRGMRSAPKSSIQEQDSPPKSPVIERFVATTEYFLSVMTSGEDKKMGRTAQLLRMILTEATDELRDAPPEILEEYFRQAAGTMYWAATGERIMNIPLPAGFADYMKIEDPTKLEAELKFRAELALEQAREAEPETLDTELPGMWERADFTGGETDASPLGPLSPRAEKLVESIFEDE